MSAVDPDDFDIVLDAARAGGHSALSALWSTWNPRLIRYLEGRGALSAEDLAADVWIELARGIGRFQGGEEDWARWVFTTARRRLTDEFRLRSRQGRAEEAGDELESPDKDPETLVMEQAGLDDALRLIRRLPPDQADAVLLRVVGGLDVAQVAEIMGRSPGSVRVLAHRGLRRLAELTALASHNRKDPVTPKPPPSIERVR